jgi:hypothetical protein
MRQVYNHSVIWVDVGKLLCSAVALVAASCSDWGVTSVDEDDASPGVRVLFREVTITSGSSGGEVAGLTVDLAMVRAQHPPYPPAHATIGHPATGRAALSIEFAASSPLGLLTAVLLVHPQRASARMTVIAGASPLG